MYSSTFPSGTFRVPALSAPFGLMNTVGAAENELENVTALVAVRLFAEIDIVTVPVRILVTASVSGFSVKGPVPVSTPGELAA